MTIHRVLGFSTSIFLTLLVIVALFPAQIIAQTTNCDATQYNFTQSYTRTGDVNVQCDAGDCEAARQGGRGGIRITCWPQGQTPTGTRCEGGCIIDATGRRTCEQAGCVPVLGTANPRSPVPACHCEAPASTSSLSCGDVCRDSSECPSECPYCAGSGTCQILPGRTGGMGCIAEQDDTHQVVCHLPSSGRTVYCSDPDSCTEARNKDSAIAGEDLPPPPFKLCDTTTDQTSYDECFSCLSNNGVWTALGCIPTSPEGFSGAFLSIAIAAGGGLALLLMLYGAFLMATSAGNPEANQKGKQVFGGAIMGLLFIIFSLVLLRIIGVEILKIPGF